MNHLVLQLLVFTMAGWINRGQQQVIEYLLEENRVLREQLGGRHGASPQVPGTRTSILDPPPLSVKLPFHAS